MREDDRMLELKIKVGHYYELKLNEGKKIVFAVLYGFEKGKNKNVYTTMMYTRHGNFEFPIDDYVFNKWTSEKRIKEITADKTLVYAL
jgi:hypothetical protein